MCITENDAAMKQLCSVAMEKSCLKIGSVTNKFKARSAMQILRFYAGRDIELLGEWIQPNSSADKFELIEKLTLRSFSSQPSEKANFILMFPKVKRLQLEIGNIELLMKLNIASIAANLEEVETLVIGWLTEYKSNEKLPCLLEQFRGIKFAKLTSIELSYRGPLGKFAADPEEITTKLITNLAQTHDKLTSIKLFGVPPNGRNDIFRSLTNAVKGSKVTAIEVAELKRIYTDEVSGACLLEEQLVSEYLRSETSVERRLVDA